MKARLGSARGRVYQHPPCKDFVYSAGDKDAFEEIGTIDVTCFE